MHTPLRRWFGVAALSVLAGMACSPSASRRQDAAAASLPPERRDEVLINHLVPARDSIGRMPERFAWTPVPGADAYSVGIWNEVDMLLWRMNNIPATSTSIPKPDDLNLEPGTYFWMISALREGQQIGDSGLAAFVVRTTP